MPHHGTNNRVKKYQRLGPWPLHNCDYDERQDYFQSTMDETSWLAFHSYRKDWNGKGLAADGSGDFPQRLLHADKGMASAVAMLVSWWGKRLAHAPFGKKKQNPWSMVGVSLDLLGPREAKPRGDLWDMRTAGHMSTQVEPKPATKAQPALFIRRGSDLRPA